MALILIPTPIGNLGDITLRALEELKKADLIACEDTRRSGMLLKHYGIEAPALVSYQKFNERQRTDELLQRLERGQRIALISDAGTPAISDPGLVVLQAALAAGHEVDVLPGATAFVPALLLSGLAPQPFTFAGFPPEGRKERRLFLEELRDRSDTLLFYLSPHKAQRQLPDFLEVLGDRPAALVREISKIHQEARQGSLKELLGSLSLGVKGELVLVVQGASKDQESQDSLWQQEAQALLAQGRSTREIASQIVSAYGLPKNRVKSWLLDQHRASQADAKAPEE